MTTAGTSARRIAWYRLGTLLLGLLAVSPLHAQTATVGNTVPLGGGFNHPYGVAVDTSGNVYVADYSNSAVKEMPPGCAASTCVTTLGSGFVNPTSVAVDSSGNVYVADYGNSAVKEMTPGCLSSSCVTPLGGGFTFPSGVAVDSRGNVYIAAYNAVTEMPPDCTSSSCVTTLGGGFNLDFGVAVDSFGNVYVGDAGNSAVKESPRLCRVHVCHHADRQFSRGRGGERERHPVCRQFRQQRGG
jgi:streptogramin lyase